MRARPTADHALSKQTKCTPSLEDQRFEITYTRQQTASQFHGIRDPQQYLKIKLIRRDVKTVKYQVTLLSEPNLVTVPDKCDRCGAQRHKEKLKILGAPSLPRKD